MRQRSNGILNYAVSNAVHSSASVSLINSEPDRWRESCRLQNGTTYNSYLIFGEDKTALVDVSHEKFRSLYMRTLREQLAKAGRSLDYVIISHTEPDHSGAGYQFQPSFAFGWEQMFLQRIGPPA